MKISELEYLSSSSSNTVVIGVDEDSVPARIVKISWLSEMSNIAADEYAYVLDISRSSFAAANLASPGTILSAYVTANVANSIAVSAYRAANSANGVAVSAFAAANAANPGLIASAFAAANSANSVAVSSFIAANSSNSVAVSAFRAANSANSVAVSSFRAANSSNSVAVSAFRAANSSNSVAVSAFRAANSSNSVAVSAFIVANMAYQTVTLNVVSVGVHTTLSKALHQGNVIAFTNTNTMVLTVNTTNEFDVYKQCEILAEKGVVTVSNGTGVIINRVSGYSNTVMQYGRAVLLHTSNSNTYILTGQLVAS